MDAVTAQILVAFITTTGLAVGAFFGLRGQRSQSAANVQAASLAQQGLAATEQTRLEVVNIQELWARVEKVEARAEARIGKLEEALALANSANDSLVIKNAELGATITLQAAQIAQLQSKLSDHLAQYQAVLNERDGLRKELEEARLRIGELERKVRILQNPGLNMQSPD